MWKKKVIIVLKVSQPIKCLFWCVLEFWKEKGIKAHDTSRQLRMHCCWQYNSFVIYHETNDFNMFVSKPTITWFDQVWLKQVQRYMLGGT